MQNEIRKSASMLESLFGLERGREIIMSAWNRLTLAEQALFELVCAAEDDVWAEHVADMMRAELKKQLPRAIRRLVKTEGRMLLIGKTKRASREKR